MTRQSLVMCVLGVCVLSLQSCSDKVVPQDGKDVDVKASAALVSAPGGVETTLPERWYNVMQVTRGKTVFTQNCTVCHGLEAEGTVADWRSRLDDGSFPPPPLNGSAHAWHHPLEVLLRVIDHGGAEFGGKMPAFVDVLEQDDKLAAIAYFQSFWTDETYQQWMRMSGQN
jgi:mono/diheme cytochrome c family protein